MNTQYKYSIASILYPAFSSSMDDVSVDIFFLGCSRHCPGCHNPELQQFLDANTDTTGVLTALQKATYAKVVSLMGGEPLEQEHLIELIHEIKHNTNLKVALFTGSDLADVPSEILDQVHYVKTGAYEQDNRTPSGSFLASKNQILWKKVNDQWTKQWEFTE